MMVSTMAFVLLLGSSSVLGGPARPDSSTDKGHGGTEPPHHPPISGIAADGQATTTLYYDDSGGACGCFDKKSLQMFQWQTGTQGFYTAAASGALYEPSGVDNRWCGTGCGRCYELTSTGKAACQTCGKGSEQGEKIIVMITNLCPPAPDGKHYCTKAGVMNEEGHMAHFDIMSSSGKINNAMWDNPVVNYKYINCPQTPLSDYKQCQCYHDPTQTGQQKWVKPPAPGPNQPGHLAKPPQ